MTFSIRGEALDEAAEAIEWYRQRDPKVSQRFADALAAALELIKEDPARFARVSGIDKPVTVRQTLVERFPYVVVYFGAETRVEVVAVMHASRRPAYWLHRVD